MIQPVKKIIYIILSIILISFLLISYNNYTNTQKIIIEKYKIKHSLVEDKILNGIKQADNAYKIAEEYLNNQMREYSMILLEKYKKDPVISNWNLQDYKKQFKDYDIYIIDKDLTIIASTFKKDLGLNFNKYPNFAQLLETRMQGNSFKADRMDIAINSGNIKKYSYQPTPDHKYLLELSINIKEKFPVLANFNILSQAQKLAKEYKFLTNIAIYKFNNDGSAVGQIDKSIDSKLNTNVPDNKKELIQLTLLNNETQVETDLKGTYKYIPYLTYTKNGKLDWWNSYVIEISYDKQLMKTEIKNQQSLYIFNTILFSLVFIAFVIITMFYFSKSEYVANHDHLTNLPNRKFLANEVQNFLNNKKKSKMAILFIDIDNFKKINDKYGHKIGDLVLQRIAQIITNALRKNDIISRIGGDEFVVLLKNINSYEETEMVINKIFGLFEKPVKINNIDIYINFSIGASFYPENGQDIEQLIKKADHAMYQAKNKDIHFELFKETKGD